VWPIGCLGVTASESLLGSPGKGSPLAD
jgi:hypothetical protein